MFERIAWEQSRGNVATTATGKRKNGCQCGSNVPNNGIASIPWAVPGIPLEDNSADVIDRTQASSGEPADEDLSPREIRGRIVQLVAALGAGRHVAVPVPLHSEASRDQEARGTSDDGGPSAGAQVDPDVDSGDLVSSAQALGELIGSTAGDLVGTTGDPRDAIGVLLPVSNQIHTVLAQLVAQAETDGLFPLDGSRSILAYLTANHPVSFQRAKTYAANGRALRDHLPTARTAMLAGILGWDAGSDLVKFTTSSQARIDALNQPVPADASTDRVIHVLREAIDAASAQGPVAATDPVAHAAPAPADADAVAVAVAVADADPVADAAPADAASDGQASANSASTASSPPDGWVRCEDWLVARGIELTAKRFRRLLGYWAAMVDPDAHERTYRENEAGAYIAAGQTLDCCHVQGKLAPEDGKILLTALDTFRPSYDSEHPTGIEERNAQALVTIARIALETNLAGDSAAARPHIGVAISWETFQAMAVNAGCPADQIQATGALPPAAWADNTGAIPPSVMAAIACDSDITRVVFGPQGQLINLGRTHRVVSPGLRAAIIARDKQCVFPRCDAPPVLCQVHHLRRWTDGGKTDADNLALLCGHHHRWIHANGVTIRPASPTATGAGGDRTEGRTLPEARAEHLGRTVPAASAEPPGRTLPRSTTATTDTGAPPNPAEQAIRTIQGTLLDTRPTYDLIDRHGSPLGRRSRKHPIGVQGA